MELELEPHGPEKGRKDLNRFTVRYGKTAIIDVLAKDWKEAEDKFILMLAYNLHGKTLDFDINSII